MRGALFNLRKAAESKKKNLFSQLFSFSVCVPDCSGRCAGREQIYKRTSTLYEQTLDILCKGCTHNFPLCEMLNFICLYNLFLLCLFKETHGENKQKVTDMGENPLIIR